MSTLAEESPERPRALAESTIEAEHQAVRHSVFANSSKLWVLGAFVCTAYFLSTVVIGFEMAAEQPNDYLSFWSAGELVLNGRVDEVYDRTAHHEQSEMITGDRPLDSLPFLLPPTFLFVSVAVAWVGFLPGMALLTTLGVLAVSWPVWRSARQRLAVVLALAAPTTLMNTQLGQLGLLFAGASMTALLDHRRHPWRSGVALAILSIKPQLGIGIGLALLAARAWRALFAGVVCSSGLVVWSVVLFGSNRWNEFVDGLSRVGPLVEEAGWGNQGVYALLTSQGVSPAVASVVQILLVLVVGVPVLRNVSRKGLNEIAIAMVLCMSVLVSPRAYAYDYQVLAPAAVLLVINRDGLRRSESITRRAILSSIMLGFIALYGFPTMPAAALTLLWLSRTFSEPPGLVNLRVKVPGVFRLGFLAENRHVEEPAS